MLLIVRKIFKSSIAQNLSVLVLGTMLSQLTVIGFQVVLSRIYSPEDFGAFAVYMSVVGIAVTVASLRYEQAIMLPKSDIEGVRITKISIYISLVFVLILAGFLYFFSSFLMNHIGLSYNYKSWLFFLPLTIFFFSAYQAINYLLLRINKYSVSASNKWLRRLVEGTVQTSAGIIGKGVGLIVGDIIAHVLIIFRASLKIKGKFNSEIGEEAKGTKDLVKRYSDFPLKNTLPSFLNALSRLLPIIIISRVFSAEITGYFHYARLVLIIPLSMITVSLNQVLLQQFSKKRNQRQSIRKDISGLLIPLLAVALVMVLVVKFFGVQAFVFVFGEVWKNSGHYAEILVWAFALKFIISPFNASFIAFEKITLGSFWQTFYFLLIASLFFVDFSTIENFLKYYVGIELIAFVIAGIINFIILHQYEKQLKVKQGIN